MIKSVMVTPSTKYINKNKYYTDKIHCITYDDGNKQKAIVSFVAKSPLDKRITLLMNR